jgi:predicted nucleic acid-binding protein
VSRYLRDTNIISNIIKPVPSDSLLAWMAEQIDENLFIASLTVAEIRRGTRRSYSNVTPIRFSFHHTTWHGMRRPSVRKIRVKCSGIPAAVATSSIAPASDILRTMQVVALPSNSIVAGLNTRLRADARLSMGVPLLEY